MLKAKLGALVLLSVLFNSAAQAVVIEGWERPIYKASLTEFDALGHELTPHLKKDLTMAKRDGANSPTQFTLTEEQQVYCIQAPCPPIVKSAKFEIVAKKESSCGSVKYTAVEQLPLTDDTAQANQGRVLEVVDHMGRLCEDYRKYLWDARLTEKRGNAIFVRTFHGNPEPVYTIQDAQ